MEAEARMSLMASPGISGGEEYDSASAVTACALVQPKRRASDDDGLLVFAEDAAEGVGDFADGGVGFDGGEDGGEEIFGSGGAALEFSEGGFGEGGIAFGAERVQAGDLGALDFGVDAEKGNGALAIFFDGCDKIVYADNDLIFFLYGTLELVSRFLNFRLDKTGFNGAQHSTHLVDLGKIGHRKRFDFVGEVLDSVGAGDGVNGVSDAGFIGENLLRAQRDERSVFGGQSERFI